MYHSEIKNVTNALNKYFNNSEINLLQHYNKNDDNLRQLLNDQLTLLKVQLSPFLYHKIDNLLKKELTIPIKLLMNKQISLWKGDIKKLKVDVIVNPANSQGIGCFQLRHNCLDNQIHSVAGPRLRLECINILQSREIPTSQAIITNSYNIHSKYIIHVVGPRFRVKDSNLATKLLRVDLVVANNSLSPIAKQNKPLEFDMLSKAYINCLKLADKHGCKHIAFPAISTGVFGYPKKESAKVAVKTIKEYIKHSNINCIFCAYTDEEFDIFNNIL